MTNEQKEDAYVAEFRGRLAETQAEGRPSLYLFRCVAEGVASRLERLERRLAHCHDWYAVRWERLRKLIHDDARHIEDEACAVMANGTPSVDEPPTYARQRDYQTAMKDVENLRRIVDGLTARVAAQSELLSRRAEGKP